jgi:hypothetical protein
VLYTIVRNLQNLTDTAVLWDVDAMLVISAHLETFSKHDILTVIKL